MRPSRSWSRLVLFAIWFNAQVLAKKDRSTNARGRKMKTIQVQLAVTIGDDTSKLLVDLLTQALKQSASPSADSIDDRREARVRDSRNALFAGQKPPDAAGLLIDSREAARLLKVSPRTLDN